MSARNVGGGKKRERDRLKKIGEREKQRARWDEHLEKVILS